MAHSLATVITYAAFLVDGNHLTNLMSIGATVAVKCEFTNHLPGGLSPLTGDAPPLPATAGGLDVHGTFEGHTICPGQMRCLYPDR